MAKANPKAAPVDDYPERPLSEALADPEVIKETEDRPEKDQIEDYHQTHPTLKTDDRAHDVEYQEKALDKVPDSTPGNDE